MSSPIPLENGRRPFVYERGALRAILTSLFYLCYNAFYSLPYHSVVKYFLSLCYNGILLFIIKN